MWFLNKKDRKEVKKDIPSIKGLSIRRYNSRTFTASIEDKSVYKNPYKLLKECKDKNVVLPLQAQQKIMYYILKELKNN